MCYRQARGQLCLLGLFQALHAQSSGQPAWRTAHRLIQCCGHRLVHQHRFMTFDEVSGLTAAYSANLMLDEPPLMVRMDCIDSLANARCVVRVWLLMEFIFPNLTLRFKPVLICLAIAAALLLVEFIGSLGNLRCKIECLPGGR